MSLAALCEEILDASEAALIACERPVDRAYRYQGPSPRIWPCPDEGELVVFWTHGFVSPGRPGSPGIPEMGNYAQRFVDIWVRLVRCYPGVNADGRPAAWSDSDAATALLDDDLDCLWLALQTLVCSQALTTSGCGNAALVEARPIAARGKTAGFEIRLIAAPIP